VIDIKVDRFPIVILANFRTGSTALGDHISKKYNIPFYSEEIKQEVVNLLKWKWDNLKENLC
jgi:hypothetical protein